jgi:hypothetical protein
LRKRSLLIGAAVGVIGLVVTAVALAVTGTQQTYTISYTGKKPATSVGVSFSLTSKDPTNTQAFGQPNPARTVEIDFPPGAQIDSTAVPQCKATDLDFQNKGASACPSNTKVGSGTASANTGFGPPITEIPANITAYNGKNTLILYVVPQGGASNPFVIRSTITGAKSHPKLTTKVAPNCIPPGRPTDNPPCGGKEAPLDSFKLSEGKRQSGKGKKQKIYLKTPKTCPKSKNWVFSAKITYRDDPPKTLTAKSPCKA